MNFKEHFNPTAIRATSDHLSKHLPEFDGEAFCTQACDGLSALELKARSNHIAQALADHLPESFPRLAEGIVASLGADIELAFNDVPITDQGVAGWMIMPLGQAVVLRGLNDHFEASMDVLRELTKRFSSEFAIRHFLFADPPRALARIQPWITDPNVHVRRLATEGTRPRLPWGIRLPAFVNDPTLTHPILEALRDDPSEYVRRSVANHLNDVAKDHPDRVASIASAWISETDSARQALVRHACRTLIKNGHTGALAVFGYKEPEIELKGFEVTTPTVKLGGDGLIFDIELQSTGTTTQPLILDYVVFHRKARGTLTPKVFKWKKIALKPGETHTATRRHPMRPVTTRRFYDGEHRVALQVNGKQLRQAIFELECS